MLIEPFSPISYGPLRHIVANLRKADHDEIFATAWDEDIDKFTQQTLDLTEMMDGIGFICGLNGEPIAAVGATPFQPNVWNGWMFATDKFPLIGLGLTRFVKNRMLPWLRTSGRMHRAQCYSMAGHEMAHNWLRTLGAVEESVVPNYGKNRETFHLFAWNY